MDLFPPVPTTNPSLSRSNSQNNIHTTNHTTSNHVSNQTSQQPQGATTSSGGFLDPLRGDGATRPRKWNTAIPRILPHEKVFPIQIGSECFKLSGASISSDAPSYFSQYFQCQLKQAEDNGDPSASVRTLYIDRDPLTFRDISLHLQGYHVQPRDPSHFVKLFADAQFYNLPRFMSQLYEENIYVTIGTTPFIIPRDLFSDPGNSPNYFSLGFAVFFSEPSSVFPGLDRDNLLRPPSIIPPSVPNRSAETFAEILHFLKGYPVSVRSEAHRAELVRDCRYFHLKGLEQMVIRHDISYNLIRQRHEIVIRLEDVRQSGISVVGDPTASSSSSSLNPNPTHPQASNTASPLFGYINYARPFTDSIARELILEIGSSCTLLHFPPHRGSLRAEFFGDAKTRVTRLLEVIASKLNLPTKQPLGLLMAGGGARSAPVSPGSAGLNGDGGDLVGVEMGKGAWAEVDGRPWEGAAEGEEENGEDEDESPVSAGSLDAQHPRKRKRMDISSSNNPNETTRDKGKGRAKEETWVVKTGQWRLRVQNARNGSGRGGIECVLVAVRIDAVRGERGMNRGRGFLGD